MRKHPKKTRRNLVRTSSILSLTASKSMARTTENRKQKTENKDEVVVRSAGTTENSRNSRSRDQDVMNIHFRRRDWRVCHDAR